MIQNKIELVQQKIEQACNRADRDKNNVTLIAVTKTKPIEALQEAYEAGARDFGENKVQELLDKIDKLPQDIRWHMIGHLQRNKVKYIVDKVYMIHSVDSFKLAEEISKEALKKKVTVNILVEVNIAEEESKFGCRAEDVSSLVARIVKLPGIIVRGLMTIAPMTDTPEENRKYFSKLKELAVDIAQKNTDNVTRNILSMDILSMGMTGDYEVAVEEGATYVRVGTGIFGERNYN